jgi:hydroxymethylglutaryl-CoA lyase
VDDYREQDEPPPAMSYPRRVDICEVGPRDGFQFEARPIPTDVKVDVIRALVEAALPRIQIASFVHPDKVPQMADAEQVVDAFRNEEGCIFSGLALNFRGVERAASCGLRNVDISIATNEKHGRDNTNMSVADGIRAAHKMIERAQAAGLGIQLGLQTVFGYAAPGDTPLESVVELARSFTNSGLESLSLADSTGMANPSMIRTRVEAVKAVVGDLDLVLHLHDTRGLGLANVVAALEVGISRFDTSLGGLGGCPFIPGATGNIATEDTVWLLNQLGVETGISIKGVAAVSRRMARWLDHPLTGKIYALPDIPDD